MKATLILVSSALLLAAAVALPALDAPDGDAGPCSCPAETGRPIESGEASGALHRLLVEQGPETTVDRGTLAKLGARRELLGRYRYWEEPQGPTLYVYDDVQDLVVRVVNPRSVRVLD